MIASVLNGFEEFKNSKNCKKQMLIEGRKLISFTIRIVKGYKGKLGLNIVFSNELIKDLQNNKITTFKFLYNENENAIAIRYDNSSNCYDLNNYTIQKNGTIQIHDIYITYTLLPILEKEGLKGYKYAGQFFPNNSCYIFRINKKLK